MEEMKMVQFQGFMGDLVRRSEREEREGLSEGVGFYRSCAWHSTWVEFLGFFFFSFGETTGLLVLRWVNSAQILISFIFHHFLAFFHICCHFLKVYKLKYNVAKT